MAFNLVFLLLMFNMTLNIGKHTRVVFVRFLLTLYLTFSSGVIRVH